MADLVELEALLALLSKHNCSRFKKAGLEIELKPNPAYSIATPLPAKEPLQEVRLDETNVPPDLRADDLFNYDKVLNWSGSPDHSDNPQMELTDDLPLTLGSP